MDLSSYAVLVHKHTCKKEKGKTNSRLRKEVRESLIDYIDFSRLVQFIKCIAMSSIHQQFI